jgi:hypothetical protein
MENIQIISDQNYSSLKIKKLLKKKLKLTTFSKKTLQ